MADAATTLAAVTGQDVAAITTAALLGGWLALGVLLRAVAWWQRGGRRAGPDDQPWPDYDDPRPVPVVLDEAAFTPVVSVHQCGCAVVFHPGGHARLAPCPQHALHRDWQAWEAQMSNRTDSA